MSKQIYLCIKMYGISYVGDFPRYKTFLTFYEAKLQFGSSLDIGKEWEVSETEKRNSESENEWEGDRYQSDAEIESFGVCGPDSKNKKWNLPMGYWARGDVAPPEELRWGRTGRAWWWGSSCLCRWLPGGWTDSSCPKYNYLWLNAKINQIKSSDKMQYP